MICVWSSWCHCHPIISCFIPWWLYLTDPGCLEKRGQWGYGMHLIPCYFTKFLCMLLWLDPSLTALWYVIVVIVVVALLWQGCKVLQWVCPSVCLSTHITWNLTPKLHQFFAYVACGCGLVLLLRHCDTLCTSGFTDDVMSWYHGTSGQTCTSLCGSMGGCASGRGCWSVAGCRGPLARQAGLLGLFGWLEACRPVQLRRWLSGT